jgi:non-canonical (house-cleaning) NTP pyrophosphatase
VLTNNPVKIRALEEAGLDVVADERSIGRTNPENVRYLASKRDRAGHMIDLDVAIAPPEGLIERAKAYRQLNAAWVISAAQRCLGSLSGLRWDKPAAALFF